MPQISVVDVRLMEENSRAGFRGAEIDYIDRFTVAPMAIPTTRLPDLAKRGVKLYRYLERR